MQIQIRTIFTNHAIERLRESSLPVHEAIKLVEEGVDEKLPKDLRQDKIERYNGNQGIFYRRNGTLLFTVKYVIDRFTFRPILLVLTVTDQRVNLRY